MVDLGSTSFVISPEAAKASQILGVKRTIPGKVSDIGGRRIPTEALLTIPSEFSFGNYRTLDAKDHEFEIMKSSSDYNAQIPSSYLNQHRAHRITTGRLYFPNCSLKCSGDGLIHLEFEITYNEKVASKPNAVNIRALIFDNASILQKLPEHCHRWLLLFDPMESERSPSNKGCDHQIELKVLEENSWMGPIYQLSQEEEKLLVQYMDKMRKETRIRPSSSSVRSAILFIPKPSGRGL